MAQHMGGHGGSPSRTADQPHAARLPDSQRQAGAGHPD
jgi:hypothetical protein